MTASVPPAKVDQSQAVGVEDGAQADPMAKLEEIAEETAADGNPTVEAGPVSIDQSPAAETSEQVAQEQSIDQQQEEAIAKQRQALADIAARSSPPLDQPDPKTAPGAAGEQPDAVSGDYDIKQLKRTKV